MSDVLRDERELSRGTLPDWIQRAWSAIWDNFKLLQPLVGYEDITFTPGTGTNVVNHRLGEIPNRWSIIRLVDVTTNVRERATLPPTSTTITIIVATISTSPSMTIRVWRAA